jgi:hypothetical protein
MKKYQLGGIIESPDEFTQNSLADNQLETIETTDIDQGDDPLAKFKGKGKAIAQSEPEKAPEIDSIPQPTIDEVESQNDPFAKFKNKAAPSQQDTIETPDTLSAPQQTEEPQGQEDPQLAYFKKLHAAVPNLPKTLDPANIKFEQIKRKNAFITPLGLTSAVIAESTDNADTNPESPLIKATLPDGSTYLFTDDLQMRDFHHNFGVTVTQALSTGAVSLLDLAGNVIRKTLDHTVMPIASIGIGALNGEGITNKYTVSDVERMMGIDNEERVAAGDGLFYTPISNAMRDAFDPGKIKKVPGEEYKQNLKAIEEYEAAGEDILSKPEYWRMVFSEETMNETALQGIGSAIEFMVPSAGIGKAKIASKIVNVVKNSGFLSKLDNVEKVYDLTKKGADIFTAAILSGSMEANVEADHNAESIALEAYNRNFEDERDHITNTRDLLDAPESREKQEALGIYKDAYNDIFSANQIPLTLLNMLPMGVLLEGGIINKATKVSRRLGINHPILTASVETGLSSLSEGIQEAYQTGVETFERGKYLNGLNVDNSTWGDIVDSAKIGISGIGTDSNTTTSFLMGIALGGGMVAPTEAGNAINQLRNLKEAKKLFSSLPIEDFSSLKNLVTNGTINYDELGKKVNGLNSMVVHDEFVDAAKRMNNPELMDYAYRQSISNLVYSAARGGLDKETVAEKFRQLFSSHLPQGKQVETDGTEVSRDQYIQKRVDNLDKLYTAHDQAHKLAVANRLPEKLKQNIFNAIIGRDFFVDIANQHAGKLKSLETALNRPKSDDPNASIDESLDESTKLTLLSGNAQKERSILEHKIADAKAVVSKYEESIKTIINSGDDVRKAIKQTVRDIAESSIKNDPSNKDLTDEQIQGKVADTLGKLGLSEDEIDEVATNTVDIRNKAIEDDLRFRVFPVESRKEGVTFNDLLLPKGPQITPWEVELRKKLAQEQYLIQKKEAEKAPAEERYKNRPLLLEYDARKIFPELTAEELSQINSRFLELRGTPIASPQDLEFFGKHVVDKLRIPEFKQAAAEFLARKTDATKLVEPPKNVIQNNPVDDSQSQIDYQDKGMIPVSDIQWIDEPIKDPESEQARRDKNGVWVVDKKGASDRVDPVIEYTLNEKEWRKGIDYIHGGHLKTGDVIQLEVEPGLYRNTDVGWDNIRIQAVTYNNGDRVVIGHLAIFIPDNRATDTKTATPQLERIRRDIFTMWNPNEHLITGYKTVVSEVLKGHIEKRELEDNFRNTDLNLYPSAADAISQLDLTVDDVEIGMFAKTFDKPVTYTTGKNTRLTANPMAQTRDPGTGTGFPFVLLRSHKTASDENYFEPVRIFTKRVKDIPGYREKLIELMDKGDIAGVQIMVKWAEKIVDDKGKEVRHFYPNFSVENGVGVIYANKNGKKTIVARGGQQLYEYYQKNFDLDDRAIHIDVTWFKTYAGERTMPHPFFGKTTLKEFVLKHATVTDIKEDEVRVHEYNGKVTKSIFHSAKVYIEPWSKTEPSTKGVEVREVTPETTPPVKTPVEKPVTPTKPVTKPTTAPKIDRDRAGEIKRRDKLKFGNFTPSFVYENDKKSKAWFKARLKEIGYEVNDAELEKLHKVLKLDNSQKIWGVARDAAIILATNRPEGTTRHEAFHIVFNLFLNPKQRETAFREVWNSVKGTPAFKGYSQEQFEEALKDNLLGERYSVGEDNEVKYVLKASNILASDKAVDWFKKRDKAGWKGDLFYEKLSSELGIPKDQVEILKSLNTSNPYNREELLTTLLANYSYTIEANVTKDKNRILENAIKHGVDVIQANGKYYETNGDGEYSEVSKETYDLWQIQKEANVEVPTKHYSNMTVPGGTNYTEVEIATPAIEPSIKGHAQFSSKNGIGWFRSDDKEGKPTIIVTDTKTGLPTNKVKVPHEKTKTRRILEIQSDLFQKGRDTAFLSKYEEGKYQALISQIKSNKLTIGQEIHVGEKTFIVNDGDAQVMESKGLNPDNENIIALQNKETKEVAYVAKGKLIQRLDDLQETSRRLGDYAKKNQFLHLLMKDNNWITFFVKSIIQDSVKKGYEKVLFPSGDTASKVEGHSTLEEFKRQKGERLKELKLGYEVGYTDGIYVVRKKSFSSNILFTTPNKEAAERRVEELYEKDANEIIQLENELKQIEGPEGLAAFAPINFFYGDTVRNVVDNFLGGNAKDRTKGNFKVKTITDEYANQWFEVELSEEVKAQVETIKLKTTAQDVYKKQGLLSQLEEYMAVAFEDFKLESVAPEWLKQSSPKLAKILNDLYNFLFKQYDILKQYFTDDRSLRTLYRQIENNSFGRTIFGGRRTSYRDIFNENVSSVLAKNREFASEANTNGVHGFKITRIPAAYIQEAIEYVNKDLINSVLRSEFNERLEQGLPIPTLYNYLHDEDADSVRSGLALIYDKVKAAILYGDIPYWQEKVDTAEDPLDKEYAEGIVNQLQTLADLINIDYINGEETKLEDESRDFTQRLLTDLAESQAVIIRGKRVVSHTEQLQKVTESEESDEESQDDSPTEEKDYRADTQIVDSSERWQINVLMEKSFNRLTPKLKKAISSIPIVDKDTGAKVRGYLGDNIRYHDARNIHSILVEKISSSYSVDRMLDKLNALRQKDERIDAVIAELIKDPSLTNDLWVGIGNKYLVDHYMNLSNKFGINVFNSNRKGVVKQIAKKFQEQFLLLNWDLKTDTPKDILGGKEGIPIKEFRDRLKSQTGDDIQKIMDLPMLLVNMGFPITDKMRDYLLKSIEQEDRNNIYNALSFILEQIENGVNPVSFTDDGGALGMILQIAEILRDGDDSIDMKMFTNGKNKLVSNHVLAGYIVKIFHSIRTDIIKNDDVASRKKYKKEFLDSTDFLFERNSPIRSWIEDDKPISFNVGYMDSRKWNNQQIGDELVDMNNKMLHINKYEFWLSGIMDLVKAKRIEKATGTNPRKLQYDWANNQFKNTKYQIVVPDSTVTYFAEMPVLESKTDIFSELIGVFEQELERIMYIKTNKANNPDFSTGDKNLDENGERFHFFPGLEKLLDFKDLTSPPTWGSAEQHVKKILNTAFRAYVEKLKKANLVKFNEKGEALPVGEFPAFEVADSFLETLELFFYNDFLMNTQWTTLLAGDPAQYAKNKTNNNVSVDWQKRIKAFHANGTFPNTEHPDFNVVYFNDIKSNSKPEVLEGIVQMLALAGLPKQFIDGIVKDYKNEKDDAHNLSDAQGYVTLDRWKTILKALGEWTSKHDAAFDRLKKGEPQPEDLLIVTQPFKPHFFGPQHRQDINPRVLLKYSAIVLHPALTKDSQFLDDLMTRMEDPFNPVDEAIFISGVKLGSTEVMDINDYVKNGAVVKNEDGTSRNKVQVLKNEFYKEQQKVPEHYNGEVKNLLGVQFRKIIGTNANRKQTYTQSGKHKHHRELVDLYNTLFNTQKKELNGQEILDFIDKVQSENIKIDRKELTKKLSNFVDFIDMLREGVLDKNLGSQYSDGLDIIFRNGKLSTRLSIANPLISRKLEEIFNSFFKRVSKQTHNGGSYVNASPIGFDDSLNIVFNRDANGALDGTWYLEVALPMNSGLMGIDVSDGQLKKISEGIVYRIPTEEKYSMFPIKVVKWLDPSVGGIIFMPREATTIAGLDFDIDKVYAIMYNYFIQEFEDPKTGKKKRSVMVPRNIKYREGRENGLLDAWRTLLESPHAFKDFIKKQNTQPLKDIREELKLVNNELDGISFTHSILKFVSNNIVGKNLIGIFAVQNAFHSLAEGTSAHIKPHVLRKLLVGDLAKYANVKEIGLLGRQYAIQSEDDIKNNREPELISKTLGMLIAAATDNAKDPILYDLNINEFTAPILSLLIHIGVPLKDAVKRINQRDILDVYNNYDGSSTMEEFIEDPDVKELYKTSRTLSKGISSLRVDSGSGPTLHDIDKKMDAIIEAGSSDAIDYTGVLPIVSHSLNYDSFRVDPNGAPQATVEYIKILIDEIQTAREHWPYFSENFLEVKKILSKYNYDYRTMNASTRRIADVEHQAILHYDLFNIKDSISFVGEFPEKFLTYATSYLREFGDTGVYARFFSVFGFDNGKLIMRDKNSLDSKMQDSVKEQWTSAMNSSNEELRELANDLIKYNFMVYGYKFTYDSFGHLIPIDFYESKPEFNFFDNRRNDPLELIAFNIAVTEPEKFVPVIRNKYFNPNNPQDIATLENGRTYETEAGEQPYYLPMFVTVQSTLVDGKNKDTYILNVADEFVKSGFSAVDIIEPSYTTLVWKDPLIKGRTFDFNLDFDQLMDSGVNYQKITQDSLGNVNFEDLPSKPSTYNFDRLPYHKGNTKTYAGVGSRETPKEILEKMGEVAKYLDKLGYKLNTGDAAGADSAFRTNSNNKEVFVAKDATNLTRDIAKEIHPNPSALKDYALDLMARNTNQVFGRDLNTPVDFVIAWTKDGKVGYDGRPAGGTGQAVEMAAKKGIPVINMANENWREDLKKVLAGKHPQEDLVTKPGTMKITDLFGDVTQEVPIKHDYSKEDIINILETKWPEWTNKNLKTKKPPC